MFLGMPEAGLDFTSTNQVSVDTAVFSFFVVFFLFMKPEMSVPPQLDCL